MLLPALLHGSSLLPVRFVTRSGRMDQMRRSLLLLSCLLAVLVAPGKGSHALAAGTWHQDREGDNAAVDAAAAATWSHLYTLHDPGQKPQPS